MLKKTTVNLASQYWEKRILNVDVLQSLFLGGEGSGWSLAGQRPVRSRAKWAKWAKEQRFPSTFPSTRLCCGGVSSDIFPLCKALYRSSVSLHLRMSAARAGAQQDRQGVCTSCLNFNLEILTNPCARSLKKFSFRTKRQLPNL